MLFVIDLFFKIMMFNESYNLDIPPKKLKTSQLVPHLTKILLAKDLMDVLDLC